MYVCTVQALTFECPAPQTLVLVRSYVRIKFRSRLRIKDMGQGQGHTSITKYKVAGGACLRPKGKLVFSSFSLSYSDFLWSEVSRFVRTDAFYMSFVLSGLRS